MLTTTFTTLFSYYSFILRLCSDGARRVDCCSEIDQFVLLFALTLNFTHSCLGIVLSTSRKVSEDLSSTRVTGYEVSGMCATKAGILLNLLQFWSSDLLFIDDSYSILASCVSIM